MIRAILAFVCIVALCARLSSAQDLVELDLELAKATKSAAGDATSNRVIKLLRRFEDDTVKKYAVDTRSRFRVQVIHAIAGSLEEPRWMKIFQQCSRDRAWWSALSTVSTKQLDAFIHTMLPVEPNFDLSTARFVAGLGSDGDIKLLQEAIAKQAVRSPEESLERTKKAVQDVLDCRKEVIAEIGEAAWREQNLQFICSQWLDFMPQAESAIIKSRIDNLGQQREKRFSPEFLKSRLRRSSAAIGHYDGEMCANLLAAQKAENWESDAIKLIRADRLRAGLVAGCLSPRSLEELLDESGQKLWEVLWALGQKGDKTSIEKLEALLAREGKSEKEKQYIRAAIQAIQKRL